eukprot:NODE_4612_length_341_cov_182.705479_g4005_i0.p1 GENE.NODE_4612_length_341_cov_182.705479_g4005_i0~~NODE_4612_length_341_cov_182.705479_g4005_i0.p1  ORF type:complete len:93 (+),score=18.13 NODE_4612_length_341_cov_182.705479_g4005_i0:26-280(+)
MGGAKSRTAHAFRETDVKQRVRYQYEAMRDRRRNVMGYASASQWRFYMAQENARQRVPPSSQLRGNINATHPSAVIVNYILKNL